MGVLGVGLYPVGSEEKWKSEQKVSWLKLCFGKNDLTVMCRTNERRKEDQLGY